MIFLPKEVLYQVSKSIHSFTNRSRLLKPQERLPSLIAFRSLSSGASKIDVKTNGSLLEIGFDFESVDPAEVDQVLKALVGQKTILSAIQESSCL